MSEPGGQIQQVQLASWYEQEDQRSGKFPPQRIYPECRNSGLIVADSRDRISGTSGFNFVTDLKSETTNVRSIRLSSCILPLLPQINDLNNGITVVHTDGTGSVTLDNGYYTVQSLVNELQSKLTALWVALDPTNVVIINYDSDRRRISIVDGNNETWYFSDTCTFITRGVNVAAFDSGASSFTVANYSKSLQMVYSRYLNVYSRRLVEDARIGSRSSRGNGMCLVAVIDLLSGYDADQYINGSTFPSTAKVFYPRAPPVLNILNRQKAIRVFDLEVETEFGENVYTIYADGFHYPTCFVFETMF